MSFKLSYTAGGQLVCTNALGEIWRQLTPEQSKQLTSILHNRYVRSMTRTNLTLSGKMVGRIRMRVGWKANGRLDLPPSVVINCYNMSTSRLITTGVRGFDQAMNNYWDIVTRLATVPWHDRYRAEMSIYMPEIYVPAHVINKRYGLWLVSNHSLLTHSHLDNRRFRTRGLYDSR